MYLMYVDESGDTGLVGSPSRYFTLSGIVVHERSWRTFIDRLIAFRKTLKSVYGLGVRTEIHASEYIRKPIDGLTKYDRLAILRNTIDELAKMPEISITNVVVDKQGKAPDYDVFQKAWGVLFQRFENTLFYGNFPGQFRDDFGMVLSDATAGQKLTQMVRRMAVYNPIPSSYGYESRNIPIKKIIEDPHFKDSRSSLPVQMADVCAYFLHQRYAPNGYIKRKSAHNYFDRLKPVLNLKASTTNAMGIVQI
jgi:Protein of unknown function (DUF3800)